MRQINVRENNGRCLLRWSYQGQQYTITQGRYANKADQALAEKLAKQIYLDCISGNFDSTLLKYKPELKEKQEREHQASRDLIQLLDNRLAAKHSQADYALSKLLRLYDKPIRSSQDAHLFIQWLTVERVLAPSTIQRYLNTLKVLAKDWFLDVAITVPAKPMPKPFSKNEVQAILTYLSSDRYYSHYHDYVYFLFHTGCRTGEVIGLRWKDIDFGREEIYIYESLVRSASGKREVRKTTKTNKSRVIPCQNGLKAMLLARRPSNAKPDDLVFTSPEGLAIDDHNFSQRCWRSTLSKLGIEHRNPYNTRHTFISHCLEAGLNPVSVAKITGHDVKTLFEHYAGVISKVEIPVLF